jgi:hypothetical protein
MPNALIKAAQFCKVTGGKAKTSTCTGLTTPRFVGLLSFLKTKTPSSKWILGDVGVVMDVEA